MRIGRIGSTFAIAGTWTLVAALAGGVAGWLALDVRERDIEIQAMYRAATGPLLVSATPDAMAAGWLRELRTNASLDRETRVRGSLDALSRLRGDRFDAVAAAIADELSLNGDLEGAQSQALAQVLLDGRHSDAAGAVAERALAENPGDAGLAETLARARDDDFAERLERRADVGAAPTLEDPRWPGGPFADSPANESATSRLGRSSEAIRIARTLPGEPIDGISPALDAAIWSPGGFTPMPGDARRSEFEDR